MTLEHRLHLAERKLEAMHGRNEIVSVTYTDGSERTMRAADAIPLLQGDTSTIEDINGRAQGKLIDLLRGLLE